MTTTVYHRHVDSIPVVDLRLLTQSELYSLSLSSSASNRLNDDVFIPKIDRSVFNESAGSRKQTYSRLRLAPRGSTTAASSKSKSAVFSQPLDHESRQIISLLKQLFPSENYNDENDEVMQTAPTPPPPQHSFLALPPPKPETYAVTGKRKRGRPRKDLYVVIAKPEAVSSAVVAATAGEARVDNAGVPIEKHEGEDEAPAVGTFVLNSEGQLVQSSDVKRKRGRPRKDEVRVKKEKIETAVVKEEESGDMRDALANADIAFAEELRKRTEGLEGEVQLLGFLEGLQGEWSSGRKKRKAVQASELGDLLPERWKILLFLKKNGGRKSLACRRFISPTGLEFVSCKEVSSYLRSYVGDRNQSNLVHNVGDIHVPNKVLGNGMQQDTNVSFKDINNGYELLHCSSMPMTSMNSYVKSIEAPREVMGMRKKLVPVKSGRSGTSLKIQEPVEIDGDDWHSSFSLGKENDIMEKYFATSIDETKSMSCEEQAMKADQTICSDGLNDGLKVATILANVPNAEIDSASNEMEKEHGADNIEIHQSTSTVDNMKIDHVDICTIGRSISGISESHIRPGTANSNVDQQSTSEAGSLFHSNILEPLLERGSDSGLYTAATNEKACVNKFNNDSSSNLYERRFDDIDLSGKNKTFCFSGDHAMPDVDSMKVGGRVPSTEGLIVLPLDGQSCIDTATNPCCGIDEQEKSLASNAFNSFTNKQTPGRLNKGGVDTAERHKVQHAKNYENNQLSDNFCSSPDGINDDTTSYINQERSSAGCSFVSYENEHTSVSTNSFLCNSILEEIQPGRVTSENGLVWPSGNQQRYNPVNHANSTTLRPRLHRSSTGEEAAISGNVIGINAQAPSTVLSEDNQLYGTESGIFSSSVLNDRLTSVPVNDLPFPNGGEKTPDFGGNLNRVYSSTFLEQSNSKSAEHSTDNEDINGFLNESQPTADSMSELLWSNVDQNIPQGGLADTSSALMQSSGSYLNFDVPSGKGENGDLSTCELFDNISCLEGLKSSRLEQSEPGILTAQVTSQSKEANMMSYDGNVEKGFSPSGWAGKGALSSVPNIESRREMGTCVWCRDELYYDDYGAGMQSGSVGVMCANCQGKFSGHVNFL